MLEKFAFTGLNPLMKSKVCIKLMVKGYKGEETNILELKYIVLPRKVLVFMNRILFVCFG